MPQYVVDMVQGPEHWTGQYGPMTSYQVTFQGDTLPVGLNQKPQTPAPKYGDVLDGEVYTDQQGRRKFKKTPPPQGVSNGSSGPPRGGARSEDEQRLILIQGRQNQAVQIAVAAYTKGDVAFDALKSVVMEIAEMLAAHCEDFTNKGKVTPGANAGLPVPHPQTLPAPFTQQGQGSATLPAPTQPDYADVPFS